MKALLGLTAFAILSPEPARPQSERPQPLGTLVDAGGYRVHLFCSGTGGPTVVVTGAGASFDWGLVQPEVAKFTRICTYDHSGVAWSDPGPADSCPLRVKEVHAALRNSGHHGPYVLVGHSLGAFVSRLYAATFDTEVAGMVIVDHALARSLSAPALIQTGPNPAPAAPPATPPPNRSFEKLPSPYYKLHQWANSLPATPGIMRRNAEIASACQAEVTAATRNLPLPLGSRPLMVVSTPLTAPMHKDLLGLSHNSRHVVAFGSDHYIMIDQPAIVINAIRQVVDAARTTQPLPE